MKFARVAFLLVAVPLAIFATITPQTNIVGPVLMTSLPGNVTVFPFQSGFDLAVYDIGPAGVPRSPYTLLTIGADYTVSGGGYNSQNQMQTGTVRVVSTGGGAVLINDQIMVIRKVPYNQLTAFANGGALTAAMIEQALDKQATLSQQLDEITNRSIRFNPGETLSAQLATPAARANAFLGFDANGSIIYPATASIIYPSSAPLSVLNITALRLLPVTQLVTGIPVQVAGYYAANDGGGGVYVWNSLSTATDNGGTIIKPGAATTGRWLLRVTGTISVKQFGAYGNGSNDDAAAINSAVSSLPTTGGTVYIPAGSYLCKSQIALAYRVVLTGDGSVEVGSVIGPTVLLKDASMTTALVKATAGACRIANLVISGNPGNTGSGYEIAANGCSAQNVSVIGMGGDGIDIGSDSVSQNCNSWSLINVVVASNAGHGLYVSQTGMNANAGTAIGLKCLSNGGDGLRLNSANFNTFVGVLSESNTGWGVNIPYVGASLYTVFTGGDSEGNTAGGFNANGLNVFSTIISMNISGTANLGSYTRMDGGSSASPQYVVNTNGTAGYAAFKSNASGYTSGVQSVSVLNPAGTDSFTFGFSGSAYAGSPFPWVSASTPFIYGPGGTLQIGVGTGSGDYVTVGSGGSLTTHGTLTASVASDNNLKLVSSGQYSSLYWYHGATQSAQAYWDNTNAIFRIGTTVSGTFSFTIGGTEKMLLSTTGLTIETTGTPLTLPNITYTPKSAAAVAGTIPVSIGGTTYYICISTAQ